jgi:tetratricopeptide (TPR) repeat protein
MTIYGLGGCGKSALAIKFAYQVTTRRARMVFWVPAISQESFETAYREIGARLRIPGIADDNSDVKKLVQTTLGSDDMADWLMIVDNADDHDVLLGVMDSTSKPVRLRDYLPRSSRGAILFTTRSRKIAEALTPSNALEVTDMDQADVEQLLKRRISKKTLLDDETAVDELLVLLTNLPLAIVQAAAFMNNNEVSVRDYISLLRNAEDETELFGNQFEDPNRYEGLDSTIAKTWQISFEQIRKHDELAADYLSFMACIDRINIPQSLLPPATSPVQQMKALGTLKGYAFITEQVSVAEKQGGGKFYDMHRLVHMASAHWLQRHNQRTTWVDAAIDRLKDVVPIYAYDELQTRTEWTVHLPHALHVANLNGVVGTLPSAEVLYRVGECQHSLGQYSTAELTFRQVLLVQEKEFGLEHPDTLQTLYVLAYVLDRQGVHAEAENMIRKTIELREKVLGDENVASLSSISTLAVILGHQGMHAKAEAIHRKTLELQRKILGEEDRHTLWSMNNLARTLHSQGKHAEAERMYRETLELRKKLLGEEHPHTLSGMSNLAGTLDDQRKYAEAERMYRETLELRKKVLGEEHPDTLRDMSNLARTLHGQKKYAEAEILYREALELQEKMLGEKHPSTLRIMGYLGRTIAKQGRYDESFTLFERACAGLVKVLGEEHPDVRWYQKDYRYHLARRERERLAADTGKLDLTFPDPNKPDIISSDNEEPDLIDHDIGKPDLIDHNTGKSDLIYRDTGEPDLKAPDAGMLASSSVVGNSKRSRMKRGLARMGIRTSKSHKD